MSKKNSIDKRNESEFFVCFWAQNVCPIFKKLFQVASIYDTHVKYEIWTFCFYLFLSYADNTYTQRPITKNVIFGFKGPQNVKIHQNLHFENFIQKQYFLYL